MPKLGRGGCRIDLAAGPSLAHNRGLQTPDPASINEVRGAKWVLLWLLAALLRAWTRTLRFEADAATVERLSKSDEPIAFVLWHNRLFLSPEIFRRYRQRRRLYGLVSASKDGAWLAAFYRMIGLIPVRGSSSNFGREAGREVVINFNGPGETLRVINVRLSGEARSALLARLELRAGEDEAALTVLTRVRAAARTHVGLAADEALTNAALGRELRGVADLADQLLARPLGPQDRGHALLARAVVHVHAGEAAAGLARVDTAWPLLPWWDRGARALAMDLSLEAGDSGRARAWTEQQAVPEPAAAIYRAWALLVDGDAMGALALLAELPQEHPRVAYLQGLALVEQRRFEEAEPWLARVEQLLPGRVEIEVARARVAVQTGDRVTALRKLSGLAEEEVYAPRAYTGLGEALLAQAPERRDLRAAQKALTRAVEREPRAAEAMLLLAQVWQLRRGEAPEGTRNALHWYEQAAASNPKLPRYREALAAYLADLGQHARAEAMLRVLVDEPGISWQTPLLLVDLVLARDSSAGRDAQLWIATANALGAEPAPLLRARALLDLSFGTAAGLRSAQARLEQRLAEAPEDVDCRILLVRVRMAQRDDEAAETLVRNGIYTVGAGSSGRLFLAWARLEQRQHKRKQAGLHARAAFHRMQAEGRPAVELLAAGELAITMFLRTEQIKLALGVSRELTAQLPDSAEVWRLEARAQLDAGESGKARRAAARAIELAPEDPLGHELRAQIALRSGDRKTATAALAEALALAKDEESRARVLEAQRRSGTGG